MHSDLRPTLYVVQVLFRLCKSGFLVGHAAWVGILKSNLQARCGSTGCFDIEMRQFARAYSRTGEQACLARISRASSLRP